MDRLETTHADGHPGPPHGIRRVTLYRYRRSSGLARDQVEHFMISAMRRPDLVDDACAVVGEMVANVINHTKSARFWLSMLPNHGSP